MYIIKRIHNYISQSQAPNIQKICHHRNMYYLVLVLFTPICDIQLLFFPRMTLTFPQFSLRPLPRAKGGGSSKF